MILIPLCIKITLKLCIIVLFLYSLNIECLIISGFRNDSTKICISNDGRHRLRFRKYDSLSYINVSRIFLTSKPRFNSNIASQKHILEKERYIRRKGPIGFQTIEVKKDPNVYNKTKEVVNKLKEIFPNSTIEDIWKNFSYSGSIHKGILSGRQLPAKNVNRPNYYKTGKPIYVKYPNSDRSEYDRRGTIKTEVEIQGIKKACRIAREILDFASAMVVEGVFTDDIDRYIHKLCAIKNVFPATLNYNGFPKSVCTSINEVACHGIPDNNVLSAGDLLKIDLGIYYNGYYGDICETYMVMPMTNEYNKKFLKTNYMGRFEKNKLLHRSLKHNNLENGSRITKELLLMNFFNMAIKYTKTDTGLFNLIKNLFKQDNLRKFNFKQDEKMKQIAIKLVQNCSNIYIHPHLPYHGNIVGLPEGLIPTFIPNDSGIKVFKAIEDPLVIFHLLNFKDENRYNKPYLFTQNFELDVELMKITYNALIKAISICKPGTKIKMIGKTIQKYLETFNCRTLVNLTGHGIGRNFHEFPFIPHEVNNSDVVMEPGMVFTIEPIVTRSKSNSFMMWPDGWTITTVDGSKTAQFEHTILITKDGHEVLTEKLPSSPPYFWEKPLEVMY